MPPITIMNGLLPMTDPSAPAPKPSKMKHTEIPATKRTLLRMTRSLRGPGFLPLKDHRKKTARGIQEATARYREKKGQQPRREHRSQIQ